MSSSFPFASSLNLPGQSSSRTLTPASPSNRLRVHASHFWRWTVWAVTVFTCVIAGITKLRLRGAIWSPGVWSSRGLLSPCPEVCFCKCAISFAISWFSWGALSFIKTIYGWPLSALTAIHGPIKGQLFCWGRSRVLAFCCLLGCSPKELSVLCFNWLSCSYSWVWSRISGLLYVSDPWTGSTLMPLCPSPNQFYSSYSRLSNGSSTKEIRLIYIQSINYNL